MTAAFQLAKAGRTALVVEADDVVGGISRTAEREGWRFDIGGHRFFTKVPEVEALWHEILPAEDFLLRPRMSRIYYDGTFFDYPLRAMNALKHGADGRTLSIAVRSVAVGGNRDVTITVADRGRGIDPSDLPHVFDAFYRGRHALERQIQGNGLGLSLVKRIAEAHGGRVSLVSSPGQGAAFTIHLPVVRADASVPEIDPAAEPAGDAGVSAS